MAEIFPRGEHSRKQWGKSRECASTAETHWLQG